ncbi:transcription termination factor 1, mitochondrial [Brachionichthys hirsutus]|uniref:transcription termination factor 1, mitochondrial n=1 Tax=Brachionichthys hirsutus TaxID=412623 RepID=UPI003604F0FF
MAVRRGLTVVLDLHHSLVLKPSFGIITSRLASAVRLRRLCDSNTNSNALRLTVKRENKSLLDNLDTLGVDVKMARRRQPGVLRRIFTNEKGVAEFLRSKGARDGDIASIISRYPRAITRSIENLEERWKLWRGIFNTDLEIVSIVTRSPESFFRTSDNVELKKNIAFLTSLGLGSTYLCRLLTTAPRTFSNSVELNMRMVELLRDICIEHGGKNHLEFSKGILSKNVYILIRSTNRVKKNVVMLKSSLALSSSELLALLQGPGARILDLSSNYVENNFRLFQQKLISLGCQNADIRKLVMHHPVVLIFKSDRLSSKVDFLLQRGITVMQILDTPGVLQYGTENITRRMDMLQKLGYDFKESGISLLDCSKKRFDERITRLPAS